VRFKPLILPALNALVWGGLVWIGFSGEVFVENRLGHVNLGQAEFYVMFPLAMLAIALVPAVLVSQTRYSWLATAWSTVTLIAVLPYLFVYGGGV
jgi:hypothetical protein